MIRTIEHTDDAGAAVLASMQFDHVAIRVPVFDAAVRWYVDTLDFQVIEEWRSGERRLAYLSNGHTMLKIIGDGEVGPITEGGSTTFLPSWQRSNDEVHRPWPSPKRSRRSAAASHSLETTTGT